MNDRAAWYHTIPAGIVGQFPNRKHGLRALALAVASAAALGAGTDTLYAGQDAFLTARMTVSSPAGANDLCQRYPWACMRSAGLVRISGKQLDYAVKLNRQINRQVRAVSDQAQYGRTEYWSLPTGRGGDCEDFALLKKKHLIAAGLDPQALMVSTVLDRNRNAHAVLVMRTVHGDYVLDNLRNDVKHWRQTGYTFLRMQDPTDPRKWTAVIDGGIMRNDNAVSTSRLVPTSLRPNSN
ncbi:MAG: transglutaminase-like cysteine peptidase [Paracoccaceae bacterium]|uniref:transglutaminase-like cysteine peptidase n=1 Tax=Seohaeicola saemankumensis TaxID=481181 RepID=UPI001E4EEE33|nr:transglutaminase-like cysteine peptidase [Seohaeicola saemankumensis]MCD1625754.1 transglutaminase-like cysteine peptidase [Seohaeicola saemankumensis]